MAISADLDQEKLCEAALAILSLTASTSDGLVRAWKGLDWDLMALLHERGWIENPIGKAKSIVFTELGGQLAPELLRRHFGRTA